MNNFEYQCDGLIGPNHNYCGLSFGNVASQANKNAVSNPKAAALQGLEKMYRVMQLGGRQVVLPPHVRPDFAVLRTLGFSGTDEQVLAQVAEHPHLLANVSSASAMWAANAGTVTPGIDSGDSRVHFTSANLNDKFHRSIEAEQTRHILAATFRDPRLFCHHPVLPQSAAFGDEGAANHTRLCSHYGDKGLHLFVYGRNSFDPNQPAPQKYPARQTLQASEAIARSHGIDEQYAVFIQQNPAVIDQGVFHNDVIAVGNRNVYLYHEQAYLDKSVLTDALAAYFGDSPYYAIEVLSDEISIEDAVGSYFFNSQLLDVGNGDMVMVVPKECETNPRVNAYLKRLVEMDNPIREVVVLDLTQSMRNGGGPACLRLRVVLNEQQAAAVNPGQILTESLYLQLRDWIERHYRDELAPSDLADYAFVKEVQQALAELREILQLPDYG